MPTAPSDPSGEEPLVLDDSFIAGAEVHELTARERKAGGRRNRRHAKKAWRKARRRSWFARRRQWITIGVVVVLLGAVWWTQDGRGSIFASDDGQQVAADLGLPSELQVVYATTSDADHDDQLPAAIAREVEIVQSWLETQTGGRRLRTVEENGTPTIQTRPLALAAETLADRSDAASLVIDEFRGEDGRVPDQLLLVFVPVEFEDQIRCGEGSGVGVAVIWVGSCGIEPSVDTESFGDGATLVIAHELMHALGAVAPCAPNYGTNGHVTDNPADLLFDGSTDPVAGSSVELDPGRDDYYDTNSADCPDIADHPIWDS